MIAGKSELNVKTDLRVKELGPEDIFGWNQYVTESPKATFYHRIEWKQIIEKSFGHKTYYLMALQPSNSTNSSTSSPHRGSTGVLPPTSQSTVNSELGTRNSQHPTPYLSYVAGLQRMDALHPVPCSASVVGILPLVHIKSLIFGSIFCSMPFLNFGGVCANSTEVEEILLREAEKILRNKKGDYLELRHLTRSSINIPMKNHKVSMTIELNPDSEILWRAFTTKHRTAVRRAGKNGLELKFGKGELLPEFYDAMSHGWKELGTPIYAYSFLKNIVDALGDSLEICLVFHEGKAIAGAFNGLHKDTVEGMWLSSLNEYAKLQAGYVLYWEMIKRACEKGYKQFHLGRSSVERGGEFFKKKWNAVAKPLYWEYILNKSETMPELNVGNPKYQRAIAIWRKLPYRVTTFIGPHLAKNIP